MPSRDRCFGDVIACLDAFLFLAPAEARTRVPWIWISEREGRIGHANHSAIATYHLDS